MTETRFDPVDLIGGAITLLIGLIASGISLTYPMGNSAAIGPGVFPLCLGGLMILLGAGIVLSAFRRAGVMPAMNMRAVAGVAGGLLAFALMIGPFGIVPATIACVALSRLSEPGWRLGPVLLIGGCLALLCWLIFVVALGLQLPVLRLSL